MKSADLVSALAGGFLDDEFLDRAQDISTMDPRFSTVFYVTSVKELVKFIRNVYEHGDQTFLSVDDIFKDIQRKWPHLLYRVHELLSGS